MRIIEVNSRLPDFLRGDMWAGIAAARVGERRLLELVERYGVETFLDRARALHGLRRARSRKRTLRELPKGTFTLEEEQDSGQVYSVTIEITDEEFIVDLRDNPDQDRGPNNASRDGSLVAAQMVFMNLTESHASANAGHFRRLKVLTRPGSVFDPTPARGVRDLLRGRDPALRPDLALPRASSRRAPAGRELRLDLRHVHRRPASRTRAGTSRSSSRRSAAGAPRRASDGNSAMFSGFHGDTFNCPAEVAEARYGLYVDRLALNDAPGGEGEHRGGKGIVVEYRVRSNGCFFTCAYTRNIHRPWPQAGGLEGSPNYAEVIRPRRLGRAVRGRHRRSRSTRAT